jgi:hypothetical protein
MSLLNVGIVVMLLTVFCGSPLAAMAQEAPHSIATFDQMPKTVTLPDGTLMAFFHPLTGEMLAATARTSSDNGHTWSDLKTLFTLPKEAGGFGYTQVFIDQAGELHLFLFCDDNSGQVRPIPAAEARKYGPLGKLDIWEAHTTRSRSAWLPPRRIWKGRAGDMQSVFQLRSGRIVLPLAYYIPRSWSKRGTGFDAYTWMGSFRSSALYSDDGGETWTQSPAVLETPTSAIGELGAIEPVGIPLKDGRIWMLIRTTVGRFYETFSRDAVAWTPPSPTNIPSSDSPAGLIRLKDGRILLLVNSCQRFPYARGGRQVLHAAVSDDEGRTWHGWREVWRDPLRDEPPPPNSDYGASYPYLTLTSGGDVVFSLWVGSGKTRSLIAFQPKWLDETSQREDFSHGLETLSAFGTHGVAVAPHPEKTDARVLQIRKPDAEWPACAVWNFPGSASGTLRLRFRLNPGHAGVLLGLTDHFSPPSDDQDQLHNLYNLQIDSEGRMGQETALKAGTWHELEMAWDTHAQQCRVNVDGRPVTRLRQTRLASYVNYLRLRSTAEDTDNAGFQVEALDEKGADRRTANARHRPGASSAQIADRTREGNTK